VHIHLRCSLFSRLLLLLLALRVAVLLSILARIHLLCRPLPRLLLLLLL